MQYYRHHRCYYIYDRHDETNPRLSRPVIMVMMAGGENVCSYDASGDLYTCNLLDDIKEVIIIMKIVVYCCENNHMITADRRVLVSISKIMGVYITA